MTNLFIGARYKKSTGCLLGIIFGFVTPFILLGIFILWTSLIEGLSISQMIGTFIFSSFIFLPFIGFQCIGIGAIVGTMNSLTNGGVGRGIEWLIIVGTASAIGTWQWQVDDWNMVQFGISGGLLGGIVGWITWKLFQIEGEKRNLKKLFLSYQYLRQNISHQRDE